MIYTCFMFLPLFWCRRIGFFSDQDSRFSIENADLDQRSRNYAYPTLIVIWPILMMCRESIHSAASQCDMCDFMAISLVTLKYHKKTKHQARLYYSLIVYNIKCHGLKYLYLIQINDIFWRRKKIGFSQGCIITFF